MGLSMLIALIHGGRGNGIVASVHLMQGARLDAFVLC